MPPQEKGAKHLKHSLNPSRVQQLGEQLGRMLLEGVANRSDAEPRGETQNGIGIEPKRAEAIGISKGWKMRNDLGNHSS